MKNKNMEKNKIKTGGSEFCQGNEYFFSCMLPFDHGASRVQNLKAKCKKFF